VCPPIAIVDIDSYYAINMIYTTHIWVFILPMLGVFIDCGSRPNIGVDTLLIDGPKFLLKISR
jgi:hypothetical protein